MDKIRVSAKTKDEAITKALIQLGTTSDRLSVNVLVQGSSGLFGIGAKPWIIEASVKEEDPTISKLEEEIKTITSKAPEMEEKKAEPAPEKKEETKPVEKTAAPENEKESSAAEPKKEYSERPRRNDRKNDRDRMPRADKKFSRGGYDPVEPVKTEAAAPEKPEREIKPISEEDAKKVSEKAVEFLKSVLSGMGMEVNVSSEFHHDSNELLLNLEGPDMGILIGKRGQTLDSLQYLTSLVVNRDHKEEYIRIKLDTEDYRKRREQTLRNLAKNIAYKVKRTHKPVSLEPMNPYERRIIHAALQNDRYATTKSEGEEPFRHVVIFAKNGGSEKNGRYGNNRSYGNRNGSYRNKGYNRDHGRTENSVENTEEGKNPEASESTEA